MNHLRCVAYIAPEMTTVSESFVQQELAAIEAAGWRVLPFALHDAAYPTGASQGLAQRTVVLLRGSRWGQWVSGLWSAAQMGRSLLPALNLLLTDLRVIRWNVQGSVSLTRCLLIAARMARALRQHRCEHIHAHFAHCPADVAMYAAAMTGLPFTFTGHAQDLFRHGPLLGLKAQRARMVLTISHYNRDWLQQQGVPAEKIDVVRCAPEGGTKALAGYRHQIGRAHV